MPIAIDLIHQPAAALVQINGVFQPGSRGEFRGYLEPPAQAAPGRAADFYPGARVADVHIAPHPPAGHAFGGIFLDEIKACARQAHLAGGLVGEAGQAAGGRIKLGPNQLVFQHHLQRMFHPNPLAGVVKAYRSHCLFGPQNHGLIAAGRHFSPHQYLSIMMAPIVIVARIQHLMFKGLALAIHKFHALHRLGVIP